MRPGASTVLPDLNLIGIRDTLAETDLSGSLNRSQLQMSLQKSSHRVAQAAKQKRAEAGILSKFSWGGRRKRIRQVACRLPSDGAGCNIRTNPFNGVVIGVVDAFGYQRFGHPDTPFSYDLRPREHSLEFFWRDQSDFSKSLFNLFWGRALEESPRSRVSGNPTANIHR